jgi:hypothetical protein
MPLTKRLTRPLTWRPHLQWLLIQIWLLPVVLQILLVQMFTR